ncbi:uncharacterized protein LOC105438970 [Strongylocentrotus purpuratus]|uniref:NACHT domain-containing protein n=1 Tax=Strongylocentrotus purpuratus TaxID=7668 RepID=A0A7M7PGH7_STRPU|nr:uncharacterized protein LOC105438970 [Strongylocentrotus purpuratus]
MVQKDARGQDTKKKETLQGSVAEIFSTKVNGELPARILISAPAGRGKTTAVAKMAYDWVHREKGSALELLPLLFVVKFRNTSQLTSIGEAIKSQLLSDVDDLTPEGLESFIRENQGICHIILDGLDEYAGISSSNWSLGSNIVSVIRWEEFPECRVLVTTRPHLENFFNQAELPRVYTKMWIEGFSQESSREYIDKFFASTSNPCGGHGHGLKVYLDDQPLINELVKTPLFCLMVCHLWSEERLNTKTATQTELLDSVNVFLMHHANARAKSKEKQITQDEITEEELIEIIRKLGKVALAGLIDDSKKLIFMPHDFRRVPAILDRACELGILSKTTIPTTMLQRSHNTTSTTIEFYHKLVQEHSAGKYLAAKTKKYMLRLKISKLDRLLRNIKANIGDYENLIRFAAGTDNSLCIRIMKALLSNRFLDESERYRILLDCSSETKGTQQNVSSLVQRCVNAESIVLKSPTVYTVVGMQNLPKKLKRQVRTIKFEGSTLTTDVTSGLWSCLKDFLMLDTLVISDSSLSFPPSPPELLSVTQLSAERVTSQCYEGVLSSIPGVRDIDVSIDVAETSNTFQITTASRPMNQTRAKDEQFFVHIRLHALTGLTTDRKTESGETIGELSLLFEDQTKNQQRLHVSGVRGRDEEALVDLFVKTKQLTYLNSGSGGGTLHKKNNVQNTRLEIEQCQLSTETTKKLLSCLRSFTSLNHLTISDSSLSFPPSPPELPSVTKLSAKRVTSQSYEGLLSSLPGLEVVDITIGDASTEDISQIQTSLRRYLAEQDLTRIDLSSLQSEENVSSMSRMRMEGLGLLITEFQAMLSGILFGPENAVIDLVQSSMRLMSASLFIEQFLGSLNSDKHALNIDMLNIKDCQLSTEMTEKFWSCLRSFTSLNHLTISDSSLSFPSSPPELPSVTKLSAVRVTSQSYEGLLSSLPGLRVIDITIDDAERDIPQITAGLRRTGGQQLTRINPKAPPWLPSEKKSVSRETMRGLGLLIREQTKDLQRLCLSGIKSLDKEDLVELVESSTYLKALDRLHLQYLDGGCFKYDGKSGVQNECRLLVKKCQLSTEMTARMWSCLRSFTSLNHLTISDSSLSFPSSPPELPSVTKLSAESLTSQSYEGLLSSLPGLRVIDITIDDAERDIAQITAGLRRTGGQQLTRIELRAAHWRPSEKKSISRETMRGLGLLIREQTKNLQLLNLSGMKCLDEEDLVELVESSTYSKALYSLHLQSLDGGCFEYDGKSGVQDECRLLVKEYQLSTVMTARMWSCLRSFTSLNHLTISDSSLSFPSSPPELPSVTELSAERVTSQSYEGLLSSLPGLRVIDITIDDAERDIAQITAGLRRTGGQQLTRIKLTAPPLLPSEKKSVSRETIRGLGLLIREQTKNLQQLSLFWVRCTDEDDLVYLLECCRHMKTMSELW